MNKKIIALLIIIGIIWSLSIALIIKHNNSSCNQCSIEFKNFEVSGYKLDEPIIIKVNATELFDSYTNDKCIITWTRTGGYSDGRS